MAFFVTHNVRLKGVASCVPKQKASNKNLQGFSGPEREKLISTLGIETRRIASADNCASDLCLAAAEKLISDLNWRKEDIDVLLFVSQTPDYILPGSSSFLIDKLGLPSSCIGYDLNQGCAGYVYGLSFISNWMASSKFKKGLLLIGDTVTKLISPEDKSLVPLFSDAGTASALEFSDTAPPIFFNTKTFGKAYESILVREGAGKTNFASANKLHMQMKGIEVFQFSISQVIPVMDELLNLSGINKEDISTFLFHQANQLIVDTLTSKLKLDKRKVPSTLNDFGNTNGASIPLTATLHLHAAKGFVLMCGFGVGLTIGCCIINCEDLVCSELIEL